jgi:hypothetical protein
MTITWGRLRRHKDRNEQAAGAEAEEYGSRASGRRRERQEKLLERYQVEQEVKRECHSGDPRPTGAKGGPGLSFWP